MAPPNRGRIITQAGPTDRVAPFRFSLRTVVGLADTDAAGVVYFGRWATFVEEAIAEYRRMLGIPVLGAPGHMVMVRSYGMDYHGAAWLGDDLEIFVRCARLGRTSYRMEARVERPGPDAAHLGDGHLIAVGVDAWGPAATPTPIPDEIRARVADFEGDGLEQDR